ncbi:MAG: 2Fe-2S iron-sulfur cluster-binding protein [Polyangiaceae bacterium]
MPIVVFESSHQAPLEVNAPDGGRLLDLCDEWSAPVPFGCRSASCGTCRIHVLEGADLLQPPAESETDLLTLMGDSPARHRLACQALLRRGSGRLRVRASAEW